MSAFQGSGQTFDLAAIRARTGVGFNKSFWIVAGVTAWAIGGWALIILPLYFETPRALCMGRGACSNAPVSWYYPIIVGFTIFLVALGALGLWSSSRQLRPRAAARVTVYAAGFEIEYGPKLRAEVMWNDNRSLPILWDGTDAIPLHPRETSRWPSGYLVESPRYSIRVSRDAFNAILESGREWGLGVVTRHGGAKRYSEEIGYEFQPAPTRE